MCGQHKTWEQYVLTLGWDGCSAEESGNQEKQRKIERGARVLGFGDSLGTGKNAGRAGWKASEIFQLGQWIAVSGSLVAGSRDEGFHDSDLAPPSGEFQRTTIPGARGRAGPCRAATRSLWIVDSG